MSGERILFTTESGSFLWGMNHPGSDHDYETVYAVPTTRILRGEFRAEGRNGSHFTHEEGKTDTQRHEVGNFVEQLLKGNINYVWALYSPLVVKGGFAVGSLRTAYTRAKNIAPSLEGMCRSALRDAELHADDPTRVRKRYGQVLRTLTFGILWMEGFVRFSPVEIPERPLEHIETGFAAFHHATKGSQLPERPDETRLRDWLYAERMQNLRDEPDRQEAGT